MAVFKMKQHNEIAKLLGMLDLPDQTVQTLTEKFGIFFQKDDPSFPYQWFQSKVTREREGGKSK